MSTRKFLDRNVYEEAVWRIQELYEQGQRVVVAFSGGKDSGVCLELAITAAKRAGRLPVEVAMRDEEILYPGTFEYCERVVERPEVDFHWFIQNQPIVNVFNREQPYWWVFDWEMDPEEWVRKPPPYAVTIKDMMLKWMISPRTFPPPHGKELFVIVGIRGKESKNRVLGVHSMKGYLGGDRGSGFRSCWPIYDWEDGDVWKAVSENHWDYNSAYDVMMKMGIPPSAQRIGPPTMTFWGADSLRIAAKAWPRWFDKVCKRCPGTRQVVHYGMRAIQPIRKTGESWEDCFKRECIQNAPEWIGQRSITAMEKLLASHAKHSTTPFPEVSPCQQCSGTGIGSWKEMAKHMFNGDPFSLKVVFLPYVHPSFFRPNDTRDWGDFPPVFK